MQDFAQDDIYYKNRLIQPHTSYEYDALYRLKQAEGREHIGQTTPPLGSDHRDFATHFTNIPSPNDNQAMRAYIRTYQYDQLGNIEIINHSPQTGTGGWTRTYEYQAASLLNSNVDGNRLTKTMLTNPGSTHTYTHDVHGNITSMPHLTNIIWDFADQLKEVDLGGGGWEYYTYTIGGGKDFGVRTRKVTERQGGQNS
jgi:hypothetical protein